jgi:transcription antitermination factor NusG
VSSCLQLHSVSTIHAAAKARWYALHTRAKHEKKVAAQLAEHDITAFLPMFAERHQWSDRQKVVQLPMFSCYVFVQVASWRELYLRVLQTQGVLQWVRSNGEPAVVPDGEIENIKTALEEGLSASPCEYPQIGQRVRLRSGCLQGVEGVLVERKGERKLVIAIQLIQQAVAVSVEGYQIEAA